MANVTYLLGAGASKQALPISAEIAERLANLSHAVNARIESYLGATHEPYSRTSGNMVPPDGRLGENVFNAFSRLAKVSQTHPSLDTYARKLFIRNEPDDEAELRDFKAAISCFFILFQTLSRTDQRYDHYFASILNPATPGRPTFPPDVKILSWNYDTQLERSFRGFTNSQEYVFEILASGANVLRLNGTCVSLEEQAKDYLHLCFDDFSPAFIQQLDNLYKLLRTDVDPPIHFAWEPDYYDAIKDQLHLICGSTEVLVVIGYSFPYFNRLMDSLMFSQILAISNLKNIYVQAPLDAHSSIKERLGQFVKGPRVRPDIIQLKKVLIFSSCRTN
jgi:hypothetical protein